MSNAIRTTSGENWKWGDGKSWRIEYFQDGDYVYANVYVRGQYAGQTESSMYTSQVTDWAKTIINNS